MESDIVARKGGVPENTYGIGAIGITKDPTKRGVSVVDKTRFLRFLPLLETRIILLKMLSQKKPCISCKAFVSGRRDSNPQSLYLAGIARVVPTLIEDGGILLHRFQRQMHICAGLHLVNAHEVRLYVPGPVSDQIL